MSKEEIPDRIIKIETPERIRFRYTLALPGTRAAALIIDFLIQAGVLLLWGLATLLVQGGSMADPLDMEGGADRLWLMMSFTTLLWFFLQWGYFSLFEILYNGRTPGKRAMKITVIHESGQNLDIPSVLLRNLLRVVDGFPFFYLVAAVTARLDRKNRRLGDLLSGTLVVIDEKTGYSAPDFTLPGLTFRKDSEEAERIAGELRSKKSYLNENQLYLIRRYLQGLGKSEEAKNQALENKLADLITEATGVDRGGLPYLEYLFHVYGGHKIFEDS